MRLQYGAWGSMCALLCACAGTQSGHPSYGGDPWGKPSVEVLPSSDVAEDQLTREMRMARRLSEESLNLPAPVVPENRSTAQLEAWSSLELKEWLEKKHQRAEAARAELDRAAAQNERQRVMAGAMVGLVYEDVARVLLGIPVPSELSSEPEIATMYRDLLVEQARPYLVHARRAYEACAANGTAIDSMHHWSRFCGSRSAQLPAIEGGPARGEGQTSVSVVEE